MQKFTLEAAKKGQIIRTRSGKLCRFVGVLDANLYLYPILCEVFMGDEDKEGEDEDILNRAFWDMENFTLSGEHTHGRETELDLFIEDISGNAPNGPVHYSEQQLQLFK